MHGLNMSFGFPAQQMRWSARSRMNAFALAMILAALGLASCGGSEPTPYEETLEGVLDDDDPRVPTDDSPYEQHTFEAGAGWLIEAELTSTDFDPYLWLIGPGGQSLQQVDDTPREGLDAHVSFTTEQQGTYILRANSREGTGRGAYTLHVRAAPAE